MKKNPSHPFSEPLRMAGVTAVLFDLDGTLINTVDHILASFRHATETVLGRSLSDEILMHNVGIPLKAQMFEFTDDPEIAEKLLQEYRTFNHACHDEMAKLYPGTREVLAQIQSRKIPMGIVTSKGTPMARRGVELFSLAEYFKVIVTADDVIRHKPDPYPVVHAAELLAVSPQECVFVGDSPHDIEAGRAAGSHTVAITWGVSDAERLSAAGPDFMIDDITELPALLFAGPSL